MNRQRSKPLYETGLKQVSEREIMKNIKKKSTLELLHNYKVNEYAMPEKPPQPSVTKVRFGGDGMRRNKSKRGNPLGS